MEKENQKEPNKIWKRDFNPTRSLVFWGWNYKNNPSFLILYGTQQFEENIASDEDNTILSNEVNYKTYVVFEGKEGHLPSFENIYIPFDEDKIEVFKRNYKYIQWYFNNKESALIENQFKLEKYINIPYFEKFNYEELVDIVLNSGIKFKNFKFAKSPNEIINLTDNLKEYYPKLCKLMSDKNLNTRRKILQEFLSSNLNKELFDYIFKLGSTELLSGLFLESAKKKIDIFIDNAQDILNSNLNFKEGYNKGLKRCINIYLNTFDKENIQEIKKQVHKELDKIIKECSLKYKCNKKDILKLKNIIQEAECYNMPEVIGEVAYNLDTPLFYNCFKNCSDTRALNYLKKYIKRILFDYGKNNQTNFMNAVCNIFTRYTENDYLGSFPQNFQFNFFIKNILYYKYDKKPPRCYYDYEINRYINYTERFEFLKNNQLLSLEGRYEFMPEIWDNNLDIVFYMLENSKVDTISKALYFIIKDNKNFNKIVENISYRQLINLSLNSYKPVSDIFSKILIDRIQNEKIFDFNFMIELMNIDNQKINNMANIYMKATNGHISPEQLVKFILGLDLDKFSDFIISNIKNIDKEKYINFVEALAQNNDKFKEIEFKIPKYLSDELYLLTDKIKFMNDKEKSDLLLFIVNIILQKGTFEDFIEIFLEQSIFSYTKEELKNILKDFDFNTKAISEKNNMIINLIKSVVKDILPDDSAIIYILEQGDSKTFKTLFELVEENKDNILNRYSTLLIFLECDILELNRIAKDIFDNVNEDKKYEILSFIIDSPIEKVYKYAIDKIEEIYCNYIPGDIIFKMMQHSSEEVKAFILNKSDEILETFAKGDEYLFIYYVKTLLLLPNKVRIAKNNLYDTLYKFVIKYKNNYENCEDIEKDYFRIEEILMDMSNSNIIKDNEKALVTLAKIKMYKQSLIEEVSKCK